jgi:hypothetical protein
MAHKFGETFLLGPEGDVVRIISHFPQYDTYSVEVIEKRTGRFKWNGEVVADIPEYALFAYDAPEKNADGTNVVLNGVLADTYPEYVEMAAADEAAKNAVLDEGNGVKIQYDPATTTVIKGKDAINKFVEGLKK